MQTLLNFLASVALLVWGTHIVRTGILRVYGADLRRVLAKSVANRFSAFLAGLAHGTYGSYDDIPNGARPDTARELQATTDHSL